MEEGSGDNRAVSPPSNREVPGFSLVELLVAMSIGLVILGAMYTVFTVQNKTFSNQEDYVEMQQGMRAAMDMTSREIVMAGYNPATIANFVGVTVNASQLQIRADLDGNGAIAGQESVIYAFDNANKRITRNIGSGNLPLLDNVQNFTFEYLNGAGVVTATSADVRRIRITITGRTAKPDPAYSLNGGYRTYTLTSVIAPRNLGY